MTDNSENPIVDINKELIEQQAQAWFVRLNSADISAVEKAEYQIWLQADSMHRLAFQELQNLWDIVGSFSDAPEIVSARKEVLRSTAKNTEKKSFFSRPWPTLAIAASAMLMVITAIQLDDSNFWNSAAQADIYQTQVGERRTVVLADNSVVLLDTNTRLVTDYSQQRRRITLEKGQARFNVAHDAQRPFSVEAGEGIVTALGTTFVVRKKANDVLVTLIEGVVEVARQKQLMTISHSPGEHEDIAQQLVYSDKGISKADIVDIPEVTAWQRGRLVFDNHSLPEVIAELNRYSDKKIIIADRSLRSIRVTGVFNAGDSHSAIKALKTYFSMSLSTDPRGNFVLKSNAEIVNVQGDEVESNL
jgi:transmembrane sensor